MEANTREVNPKVTNIEPVLSHWLNNNSVQYIFLLLFFGLWIIFHPYFNSVVWINFSAHKKCLCKPKL